VTLVVIAANREHTILVADRRLSSDGQPLDAAATKAAVVVTRNGRFGFGYTGLAQLGAFHFRRWALPAITNAGPPDCMWGPMLCNRFAQEASLQFASLGQDHPNEDFGVSTLFAGYSYEEATPRFYCVMVSNIEALTKPGMAEAPWPVFRWSYLRDEEPGDDYHFVAVMGSNAAWKQENSQTVASLLHDRWKPTAVRDTVIDYIRAVANEDRTIGFDCNSLILPSDPLGEPEAAYHPRRPGPDMYGPDLVVALCPDGGLFTIMSPEIWTEKPPWWRD